MACYQLSWHQRFPFSAYFLSLITSSPLVKITYPIPAVKMSDDPLLQMYEAQAIAIEQQAVIDRLEREKEEMAERLRRLELGREGELV